MLGARPGSKAQSGWWDSCVAASVTHMAGASPSGLATLALALAQVNAKPSPEWVAAWKLQVGLGSAFQVLGFRV
jgi:amino acid transporter